MLSRPAPNGHVQEASQSEMLARGPCADEARVHQDAFNIDELAASPWMGLHYRHEFLIHYLNELLEKSAASEE